MARQNQGFRRDINLEENTNDTTTLNNLGGAGIANDLRIIQNNLRNISTVSYNSLRASTSSIFLNTNPNISYNTISGVDQNLLNLDIYHYGGDFGGNKPVVIYIHGGAWATGDKANIDSKSTFFNNNGYVFVSVNYRLSPLSNLVRAYNNFVGDDGTTATVSTRVKHSNHVSDCARAVTWVYNNIRSYGGDPNKLILIGSSAGGHLASLLATNQSYLATAGLPSGKVIGCISLDTEGYDIYKQITNPVSGGEFSTSGSQKAYQNAFGIYPDNTVTGTATTITTDFATTTAAQSSYTTASPISNISDSTPPFLVFRRGSSDRIARETEFVTALQTAGRTVTAVSYPDDTTYTHGEINESVGATNDPPVGKSLPVGVSNVSTQVLNFIQSIAPSSFPSPTSYFFFGQNNEFTFTNDDIVGVSTNVVVGVGLSLVKGVNYYVCNSDAKTEFRLSTTPSAVGINTVNVTSVSTTNFYFIRNDSVNQQNLINFIAPRIQDITNFSYIGISPLLFDSIQLTQDTASFLIDKKYKSNEDVSTTTDDLKYEGTIIINDPVALNSNSIGIASSKSPGIFIGTTRAFSSDNNPWSQVGTALSTSSSSVSLANLYFANDINITGISTESATQINVTSFTHKMPVVVNGETYYLLLST